MLKDPSVKEPSNTIWHQVLKHADKIGHSGDELEFVQNIVAQVAVIIDIFKTLIKTSCSVAPSNTQSQGKIFSNELQLQIAMQLFPLSCVALCSFRPCCLAKVLLLTLHDIMFFWTGLIMG